MSNQLAISSINVRQFKQLYSLNDLHIASGGENKHKPAFFLRNDQTKNLINEINRVANLQLGETERSTNMQNAEIERFSEMSNAVLTKRGGDLQGTFACKEVVYAYAMSISPAFMLKVIRAYDDIYGGNKINTEQQHLIRKAVDERVQRTGEHHQSVYSRLYNAFKIPSYKDLPASKFNDAIEFLGGVATKNGLSDDDWYSLAWLYKAADKMRFTCSCIESALRELGSSHAGAFYSMTHDYNHTLKEAKEIIARGTAHIKPKGIDDNWNNVLPIIRHNKPKSRVINFAADIPYID